jgi:hypothetical protein
MATIVGTSHTGFPILNVSGALAGGGVYAGSFDLRDFDLGIFKPYLYFSRAQHFYQL